jgi:lipoate-protein ligase A
VILWCDGAHDPGENMRRDTALLAAAEAGAEPVLRLFRFVPHGITLGLNQEPARELDLARCASDDISWASRPTGGRAIFHAEEWTYSLAASLDDRDWGGGLSEAYARASALIVRSLLRLGVPAAFAPRDGSESSDAPGGRGRIAPAAPCFASTARHEVVLGGRKLVGSAQRRTARALLQQGSVLLGAGHLRLADYLPLSESRRERVRGALASATAGAAPWIGLEPALERWADSLAAELGPRSRRVDAAAGAFLLTGPTSDSYTAPAV